MYRQFLRRVKKRFRRSYKDINPEDVFIDSKNLPGFQEHRLEGRIEKPVGSRTFIVAKVVLVIIILSLASRLGFLGIVEGETYTQISENNRLEQTLIFANRGVIYDRNMLEVASNAIKEEGGDFAKRNYAPFEGLAHVTGFVKYPLFDKAGNYYEEYYRGRDGIERAYDGLLRGENGLKLRETDVKGTVTSESVVKKPEDGMPVILSIDAKITEVLFKSIKNLAVERGFVGGAGVIIDVETGEIIALTSYPEYDSGILTEGADKESISRMLESPAKPFLNRAIGGLYTPGSVVKPIVALSALEEGIISPEKEILSTGSITVPNPYDPTKPSIFKDWKAHGWTNMREALAVSSDTYFYSIGGGFEGQKGLGITALDKYFNLFSIADKTGIELSGEVGGVIPTPEWKKEKFNGDIWRLGDTYITSIGQYGTQVTPLAMVRAIATIANSGKVLKPSLLKGGLASPVEKVLDFNPEYWSIVRGGMRDSVTYGTSVGLNVPYVEAAAKTGTAELGSGKLYVHSWSVGFFPYNNPRYAWAVVMEKGPSTNTFGATSIMRQVFDWAAVNAPVYFE